MNKILKSYRIKKRWYLTELGVLRYIILDKNNKRNPTSISGTIKSLNKKKGT